MQNELLLTFGIAQPVYQGPRANYCLNETKGPDLSSLVVPSLYSTLGVVGQFMKNLDRYLKLREFFTQEKVMALLYEQFICFFQV